MQNGINKKIEDCKRGVLSNERVEQILYKIIDSISLINKGGELGNSYDTPKRAKILKDTLDYLDQMTSEQQSWFLWALDKHEKLDNGNSKDIGIILDDIRKKQNSILSINGVTVDRTKPFIAPITTFVNKIVKTEKGIAIYFNNGKNHKTISEVVLANLNPLLVKNGILKLPKDPALLVIPRTIQPEQWYEDGLDSKNLVFCEKVIIKNISIDRPNNTIKIIFNGLSKQFKMEELQKINPNINLYNLQQGDSINILRGVDENKLKIMSQVTKIQ